MKLLSYNQGLARYGGPGRWNDLDMLEGDSVSTCWKVLQGLQPTSKAAQAGSAAQRIRFSPQLRLR